MDNLDAKAFGKGLHVLDAAGIAAMDGIDEHVGHMVGWKPSACGRVHAPKGGKKLLQLACQGLSNELPVDAGIGNEDLGSFRLADDRGHAVRKEIGHKARVEASHGVADKPRFPKPRQSRARGSWPATLHGRLGTSGLAHGEKALGYGGGQVLEEVLAHEHLAVFEGGRKMQALLHDGEHLALHVQKAREKAHDGIEGAALLQILAGHEEVAERGRSRVEVPGHFLQEGREAQAQALGLGLVQSLPEGVRRIGEALEPLAQHLRIPALRKALVHAGHQSLPAGILVRKGHEPVSQVAWRRHVEGLAQAGRGASGIEGGHKVHGAKLRARHEAGEPAQGRAAAEKDGQAP